jgi:hypothetical protein
MKRLSFLIVFASLMLFSFGLASAVTEITLDNMTGLYAGDSVIMGESVRWNFRLTYTPGNGLDVTGSTNGFEVYTHLGGAYTDNFTAITYDTFSLGWPDMFDLVFNIMTFSIDGVGADTVGFGGAKLFGPGIIDGTDDLCWWIETTPSTDGDTLCIDSAFYPPGGEWYWATSSGPVYPDWGGPYCFHVHDTSWVPPTNLLLVPDSLYFTAVAGGSSPPSQSFMVSSDNDPLDFNIIENINWAIPSPIQGTTDQTITVLMNITGLSAGTYIDSLKVEAPEADNSPQYVKLVLFVESPPPTIGVTPGAFFFNAIAGEPNPPSQTLTITNEGGSTLNWSVSSGESWLGLNPMSGVDSGDVTVSVDITGLPIGEYHDTIVVSDTNATNDPFEVPVTLNVASDLPVIAVDSAFNFIVVPTGVSSVPPRDIFIKNEGGGTMNFWLEENSTRIFTLNPSSGTAPQVVEVGFKIIGGQAGEDYYDTLWVFSNQAINSPFPVVFLFHYVDDPAELYLSRDSIQLNVFECDMGAGVDMPSVTFFVNNVGGDNPLPFYVIYESDYFATDYNSGVAPFAIKVTANDLQLPLGTYYDTILVAAQKAINSPKTLIVQFNMIAGLDQPEIYLSKDSYVIPTQENAGPNPPFAFEILNRFGGCMPWEIDEDVPWMFPDPDSGDVHGIVDLYVDAAGYVFGEYTDSFFVVAPSASNSPRKVDLLLRVWRFHGDLDYNAKINVVDLVYMVDFLFNYGPMPEPELVVGDLNCNHAVNVIDLTYFVEYLFFNGPIPCGNPYK